MHVSGSSAGAANISREVRQTRTPVGPTHHWVFGGPWTYDNPSGTATGVDKDYLDEVFGSARAWVVGRTMHDVVDGWGDDPGFGVPVFVVTHRPNKTVVKGDTSFEFVTDGIDAALERPAPRPATRT